MKRLPTIPILLVALLAILLSGCGTALAATSWPGVTASEDTVYVAYANRVFAINGDNGTAKWQYPQENGRQTFFAVPALSNGQVIVGDYSNVLVGLDASTGVEQWRFTGARGRWIGSAVVVDDLILAPNGDYNLYALNTNGQEQWRFHTDQALWAQPLSDGETVYQASMDHFLYAIDITNGQEIWSTDMGGALVYSPVMDEQGVLYAATLLDEVLAIDPQGGEILWRQKYDTTLWTQPAVHEGALYFGDLSGNIYALSTADGSQLWTKNLGEGVSVTGSPTIIEDGVVFATEDNGLQAYSLDGSQVLWSFAVNGKLYNGPVIMDGRLVVGLTGADHLLVALNQSGSEVWKFTLPE
ncbi:MAG TPA: PQQ-binding-like beta-propeller repeat protein [Anaerolineaceae bacterium]|nr:PQQ-binding-like beta-propeller repeat protein [Anaerolineaceae bacterium]